MTYTEYVKYLTKSLSLKGGDVVGMCFHCNEAIKQFNMCVEITNHESSGTTWNIFFHRDCFRNIAGRRYTVE